MVASRMEHLATKVFDTLLSCLRTAEVMPLAVDESTDNTDVAQLFLRAFIYETENCWL